MQLQGACPGAGEEPLKTFEANLARSTLPLDLTTTTAFLSAQAAIGRLGQQTTEDHCTRPALPDLLRVLRRFERVTVICRNGQYNPRRRALDPRDESTSEYRLHI